MSPSNSSKSSKITRGGHVATGTSAQRRARTSELTTRKSTQTRQALVDAARRVFSRDGYMGARVADITREAEVAHGSFYTYFQDKREVFQAVVDEVGQVISDAVGPTKDDVAGDHIGNLERANRRYLLAYQSNAAILRLVEQVATAEPEVHRVRVAARRAHVDRIELSIRRMQDRGLADAELDPHTIAGALVSMLASFAHWSTVDPDEYAFDDVVRTLTLIWARSLGMDTDNDAAAIA